MSVRDISADDTDTFFWLLVCVLLWFYLFVFCFGLVLAVQGFELRSRFLPGRCSRA
jgi:hypothetical protein